MRYGLTSLAIAAALMLLFSALARADTDVSVRIDAGGGEYSYDYGADWFWGDPVLYGDWDYSHSGLGLTYSDRDWRARFDARGRSPFPENPNDRGGYRVFIPHGRQGPPELYGDYNVDAHGYPVRPRRSLPYRHHRSYRSNYPVVIPYSYGYGYSPYGYYGMPLYTAPAYPEYGYYPERRGLHIRYGDPGFAYGGYGYSEPAVGDIYNDNRVINNYYGDAYVGSGESAAAESDIPPASTYTPPSPPVGPMPPAPVGPQPPPKRSVEPEPSTPAAPADGRAIGARFYDQLRLETPDGAERFTLQDGTLSVAAENGPGAPITANADQQFGVFAAWLPDAGTCLIFREGDGIAAAYRTAAGEWWIEPLSYNVDFGGTTSIGLVGGEPWVTFTAIDGARYVVAFRDKLWQDIGSGSSGK